jgi:hypothetical protein
VECRTARIAYGAQTLDVRPEVGRHQVGSAPDAVSGSKYWKTPQGSPRASSRDGIPTVSQPLTNAIRCLSWMNRNVSSWLSTQATMGALAGYWTAVTSSWRVLAAWSSGTTWSSNTALSSSRPPRLSTNSRSVDK